MTSKVTLLVVVVMFAGCAPPVAPQPVQRYVADGAQFPQVAALFSAPSVAQGTNTAFLQRLADSYDVTIWWPDAAGWTLTLTPTLSQGEREQIQGERGVEQGERGVDPVSWMRQQAPAMVNLAYVPAGYWWTRDDNCRALPLRCEVRALIDKQDWWLRNAAGERVEGWGGQGLLDLPRAGAGLNEFWSEWYDSRIWDGVAWDVTDGNFHYFGGNVDFDQNGVSDVIEHGRLWLDDLWTIGIRSTTAAIGAASIGNGAWMPRLEGELSQLAPPLHGSIVELPSRWRDPESGRWLPSSNSELISWHIENLLALKARDPESVYLILAKPDQFGTTYWRQYLPERVDQDRMALGVALLTGNAVLFQAYGNVPWCDECGVSNGVTSWDRNWLGRAIGPAVRVGTVWNREFERGAVYVNAGEHDARVIVPGMLRQIRGWYDRAHNAGGWWTGTLAPYETRVLWRSGPPMTAPTATPAGTVTLDALRQRVEALETRVAR